MQELLGWFKGNGDFGKPAIYTLQDVSKMMKPLPLVSLCKVHDCLDKVYKFLTKNDDNFRCGLVWKGKAHLEIFAKHEEATGGISKGVRDFLATQCKDDEPEEQK